MPLDRPAPRTAVRRHSTSRGTGASLTAMPCCPDPAAGAEKEGV